MKKLLFISIFILILNTILHSQSIPPFNRINKTIEINNQIDFYKPDPDNEIIKEIEDPNNPGIMIKITNAVYNLNGVFFNETEGYIPVKNLNFRQLTPFETLADLFFSYKIGNLGRIKGLHTPKSLPKINQILSKPNVYNKYLTYATSINKIKALIGFDFNGGFFLIVKISSTIAPDEIMPYFFEKISNKWFLSTLLDNNAQSHNIAVFLKSKTVTELINE